MTAGGAGGAVLGVGWAIFFPFLLQFHCLDKASVTMQGDVAEPRCTLALVVAQWGHISGLSVPSVGTWPNWEPWDSLSPPPCQALVAPAWGHRSRGMSGPALPRAACPPSLFVIQIVGLWHGHA